MWLKVPARLTYNDRLCLRALAEYIAKDIQTPVIVNIGLWRGGSMCCLREGAPTATLIGVDVRILNGELLKKLDARIIKGDSCQCADLVDAPVHLLFIDGDHHEEAVRCDIAEWIPKIPSGGVVAFHDYSPPAESLAKPELYHLADVKRVVDEWQEDAKWDVLYRWDSMIVFERPVDDFTVSG